MSKDTNPFGGKNPHGLYVPISEDEQEVLSRLVETKDLEVVVHGWGISENPDIIFGDFRVSVPIRLDFEGLKGPTTIRYFDLELRTQAGLSLFRQRMAVNPPYIAHNGTFLAMAWDIAIDHMDPAIVKMLKPGAIGLTSRRLDRDTKERSQFGNMRLLSHEKFLIHYMDQGANSIRAQDTDEVVQATKDSGKEVKKTSKGLEVSDE